MAAKSSQMSIAQTNMIARNYILHGDGNTLPPALDVFQRLNPSLPATVAPGTVLSFQPRNVGLIKRFYVSIKATVTAGASAVTLTPLGLANMFSMVDFTDLGNFHRITTPSWHLNILASAKRRRPFGAAFTTDTPNGMGNVNNRIMYAPQTIAANTSAEIDFQLEIPLVKNDFDLRGAIYGDITSANMQCQLTINPNLFASSTADPTFSVYQSAGADVPSLSNVTWQVTQNYLDQLPMQSNGVALLPPLDIATAYMINSSVSSTITANNDNTAAFTNNRRFESLTFIYNNGGTLNVNGSDLNYVRLQSANMTNILDLDPKMLGLMGRNVGLADFPKGTYYLDFRQRPIDTNQYGNMQLVVNPSSAQGNALLNFGWESYGIIGQVTSGGSIPSGG